MRKIERRKLRSLQNTNRMYPHEQNDTCFKSQCLDNEFKVIDVECVKVEE